MKKKLFKEEGKPVPIQLTILDLPHLHSFNSLANDVMAALTETDYLDIFENDAIKYIITEKWEVVRKAIMKRMFIPYCFFLLIFTVFINFILPTSIA